MRPARSNRPGFTLVEMLIVAAMLAVVSLAMYAVLNNGLRVWQRVNRDIPQAELALLFDRLTLDLKNALRFEAIKFKGERSRFSFPTLVNSPAFKARTIGEASYVYDQNDDSLSRIERDFSQAYRKEDTPAAEAISGIKSLEFSYYFYDQEANRYIWLDAWSKKGLPLAVRLDLEFDDGKDTSKFTKTIGIPAGG